jgi:hypothetical protein
MMTKEEKITSMTPRWDQKNWMFPAVLSSAVSSFLPGVTNQEECVKTYTTNFASPLPNKLKPKTR